MTIFCSVCQRCAIPDSEKNPLLAQVPPLATITSFDSTDCDVTATMLERSVKYFASETRLTLTAVPQPLANDCECFQK